MPAPPPVAVLPPPPPTPAPEPPPRPAPAGPSSPEEACADRLLLGKSVCVTEQCRQTRFAQHPQCVQLRAMEQRRRDQEALHN